MKGAALLVAIGALSACATAHYDISSTDLPRASGNAKNGYSVHWTLTSRKRHGAIEAVDLNLAGNVFVSYVSGLPSNVVGYVNVSSSSRDVVNAVSVAKHHPDEDDNENDIDDNLNVKIKHKLSVKLHNKVESGDLLTEIVLGVPNAVAKFKSKRSAQVVVKDNVLMNHGKKAKQKVKAKGTSAVYVSGSAVTVHKLTLATSGHARIEYNVDDVKVTKKLKLKAKKSSSIKLLSSSVKTKKLTLKAKSDESSICLSAKKVVADKVKISGEDRVSMPNSSESFGAKGTFVCKAVTLPSREHGQISASPADSEDDEDVLYSVDDLDSLVNGVNTTDATYATDA
ncbi:hypothetical protein PsorP6_014020 [Peronosclerospora sorghi]|uniref:Uncharacterized protein n=1 Tax=Peronosclerospora sorghi TaxID=230839 RepID=A0ACC0VGF1_9STRA|nr:hypothetical protein PsorP6_014020 [Peronosclerospora sorghi]